MPRELLFHGLSLGDSPAIIRYEIRHMLRPLNIEDRLVIFPSLEAEEQLMCICKIFNPSGLNGRRLFVCIDLADVSLLESLINSEFDVQIRKTWYAGNERHILAMIGPAGET